MALSKPLFNLLGVYFEQLYTHPIRTKCISSCVIATLGNLASQYMMGNKVINQDSLIAFGLYGLLFGGTVPHYFYNGLDNLISHEATLRVIKQLIIERLIYTPLYQMLTLYMLARFEGHSHPESVKRLLQAYWPILKANWKWLTLLQYINLALVPPMLRVLVVNLIGFFWVVYISHKRRQSQDQRRGGKRQ